uniref:Putative lpxtg-motif cell wall anchor domain-containing protein n=1 Tax=Amblyomma triste TaxID=251400 RepID=A0A023G5Z3_AMBTT
MASNLVAALYVVFGGALAAEGSFNSVRCSADLAYHCYHNLSKQFVVDRLLPEYPDGKEIFESFCARDKDMPLKPKCKYFYSGCLENEKQKFHIHELGYDFLRRLSIDMETCLAPTFLHICLDADAIKNCFVERPHEAQSLYNFRKKSYGMIEDVSYCVKKALEKCESEGHAQNLNTVHLALDAATQLNWFDETVEVEPTTPSTTKATTTTTLPSEASTEVTTETTTVSKTTEEVTTTTKPTKEPTSESSTESSATQTHTTEHSKEYSEGPYSGRQP